MACVLAGGWFRSLGLHDFICIPSGELSEDVLGSADGCLAWGLARVDNPRFKPSYRLVTGTPADPNLKQSLKFRMRWNLLGFAARDFYEIGESQCVLPYGFIVLPLTLLSAYLIFWKSRKPKSGPTHVQDTTPVGDKPR